MALTGEDSSIAQTSSNAVEAHDNERKPQNYQKKKDYNESKDDKQSRKQYENQSSGQYSQKASFQPQYPKKNLERVEYVQKVQPSELKSNELSPNKKKKDQERNNGKEWQQTYIEYVAK